MNLNKILVSALVFVLAGCDGGDDTPSSDPLGVNGSWVSNCYLDNDDEYVIDSFDFSGLSFSTSFSSYENATCSGSPIDSGAVAGVIEIGEIVTTDSGLEAKQIKFKFDFQGSSYEILDIIRVNGDEFLFGVYENGEVYPTALDFDIILSKQ